MEKTLSRKMTRLWMASMFAAIFFVVLMIFIGDRVEWIELPLSGFVLIGATLMRRSNRCPHCKEFFRGGNWNKANAGYCKKCGKLMEYDDTVAERNQKKEP